MTIHILKCHPEYYAQINAGVKTFELRVNDRNYQAGDILLLRWYDPAPKRYRNMSLFRKVTGVWGCTDHMNAGHVALGIRPLTVEEFGELLANELLRDAELFG